MNPLETWEKTVGNHMPHLSRSQAALLAMWSFGIVLVGTSGINSVTWILALLLDEDEDNLRQRLREWCWDKNDKAGKKRCDFDPKYSFVSLLSWILSWWQATSKWLVLGMDATTLGERFVVLVISVLYRGHAIPVGWVVLPACKKEAWKEHWIELFGLLEAGIQKTGWHPFLRINQGGKYRQPNSSQYLPLSQAVPAEGKAWGGEVVCFKNNPVKATLLACWDKKYKDPWLILTDIPAAKVDIAWYGIRAWIECGFKDLKSAGWQWQNTRMTDPRRASRLWLAMAVATLWTLSVGGAADAADPEPKLVAPLEESTLLQLPHRGRRARSLSCFRKGIYIILAMLILHRSLPVGLFIPDITFFGPRASQTAQ
jgi:hypothetical protein